MNELQLIYDIATNLSDYLICFGILVFLWLVAGDDGLVQKEDNQMNSYEKRRTAEQFYRSISSRYSAMAYDMKKRGFPYCQIMDYFAGKGFK